METIKRQFLHIFVQMYHLYTSVLKHSALPLITKHELPLLQLRLVPLCTLIFLSCLTTLLLQLPPLSCIKLSLPTGTFPLLYKYAIMHTYIIWDLHLIPIYFQTCCQFSANFSRKSPQRLCIISHYFLPILSHTHFILVSSSPFHRNSFGHVSKDLPVANSNVHF